MKIHQQTLQVTPQGQREIHATVDDAIEAFRPGDMLRISGDMYTIHRHTTGEALHDPRLGVAIPERDEPLNEDDFEYEYGTHVAKRIKPKPGYKYPVDLLARAFARNLREWARDGVFDIETLRTLEESEKLHDLCDPNQAMIDALDQVGDGFRGEDRGQWDFALRAWELAHLNNYYIDEDPYV